MSNDSTQLPERCPVCGGRVTCRYDVAGDKRIYFVCGMRWHEGKGFIEGCDYLYPRWLEQRERITELERQIKTALEAANNE